MIGSRAASAAAHLDDVVVCGLRQPLAQLEEHLGRLGPVPPRRQQLRRQAGIEVGQPPPRVQRLDVVGERRLRFDAAPACPAAATGRQRRTYAA